MKGKYVLIFSPNLKMFQQLHLPPQKSKTKTTKKIGGRSMVRIDRWLEYYIFSAVYWENLNAAQPDTQQLKTGATPTGYTISRMSLTKSFTTRETDCRRMVK